MGTMPSCPVLRRRWLLVLLGGWTTAALLFRTLCVGACLASVPILRAGQQLEPTPQLAAALWEALARAARSGTAGFAAGVCQVVAFMWLRTAMNYQYKNGGSLRQALRTLWAEGGLPRLYQGLLPWGMVQAPLARFGDTAANEGVLAIAGSQFPELPVGVVTLLGSVAGSCWRVVITPVDTCKTVLQTDGAKGWSILKGKVQEGGLTVLWYGWEGNMVANIVGNYPWFVTLNALSGAIPTPDGFWMRLVRHACIGAVAATASDLASNSFRVLKTQKQTSTDPSAGYVQAARTVIARDGVRGLFLRGLETRIFTNILQGAFFTVLWKGLSKRA